MICLNAAAIVGVFTFLCDNNQHIAYDFGLYDAVFHFTNVGFYRTRSRCVVDFIQISFGRAAIFC